MTQKKETNQIKNLINAVLELHENGKYWTQVELQDIEKQAGLSCENIKTKNDLIPHIIRQIDDAVYSISFNEIEQETEKDRLFAILMERFETLQPYKSIINSLFNSILNEPDIIKYITKQFKYSMLRTIEEANLSSHSASYNNLQAIGLGAIYIDSLRIWIKDESPDMDKTMAYLDNRLRQADKIIRMLEKFKL